MDCPPTFQFHLSTPSQPFFSCADAPTFVAFRGHCSLDDANDPSIKYLEMLEGSFVWEARSLFLVLGAPMFVFYQPAGLIIGGLGVLVVVVMVRPHFQFVLQPSSNQIPIRPLFVPILKSHHGRDSMSASYICHVPSTHRRHPHFFCAHLPRWPRTRFFLAW